MTVKIGKSLIKVLQKRRKRPARKSYLKTFKKFTELCEHSTAISLFLLWFFSRGRMCVFGLFLIEYGYSIYIWEKSGLSLLKGRNIFAANIYKYVVQPYYVINSEAMQGCFWTCFCRLHFKMGWQSRMCWLRTRKTEYRSIIEAG